MIGRPRIGDKPRARHKRGDLVVLALEPCDRRADTDAELVRSEGRVVRLMRCEYVRSELGYSSSLVVYRVEQADGDMVDVCESRMEAR